MFAQNNIVPVTKKTVVARTILLLAGTDCSLSRQYIYYVISYHITLYFIMIILCANIIFHPEGSGQSLRTNTERRKDNENKKEINKDRTKQIKHNT